MKKFLVCFFVLLLAAVFPRASIHAQNLIINGNGVSSIQWKGTVLGESTENETTEESKSGTSNTTSPSTSTKTTSLSLPLAGTTVQQVVNEENSLKEVSVEDGRLRVKIKPVRAGESEIEDEREATRPAQSVESIRVSEHAGKRDLTIRANNDEVEVEQGRVRARTRFPITIGPNNELIITTPAGTKVVTILPEEAVKNLIQKGFPVASSSASTEPSEVSPSAELDAEKQDVELQNDDGTLTYHAKQKKIVKFLGIIPVEGEVEAKVSAETGQVLEFKEPWYLTSFGFLFR